MKCKTIVLEISKNVLKLHGFDGTGKTVLRKQLKRDKVLAFFANMPPFPIDLEDCSGAH